MFSMILTTHAIVGAAVAQAFPDYPILAFSAAFLSHFLLDSIPHWDYEITSSVSPKSNRKFKLDKNSIKDLIKIGIDFLAGVLISYFLFGSFGWIFIVGAAGGVFPDFLQFLYKFFPNFFAPLERFHLKIQRHLFNNKPFWGIFSQAAVVSVILFLFLHIFTIAR